MQVLLATDGSPCAQTALDLVAAVDWPEGTRIRVAEAIDGPPVSVDVPWPAVNLIETDKLEEVLWQEGLELLERARTRIARAGLDVSTEIMRGRPATAIVDAATAWGADLIIVGSRGHGTIRSMILGSVSAEVVDHSPVPVLVARASSVARVIVALDGSPCAQTAADVVRTWPIFAASRICALSVADTGNAWWTGLAAEATPIMVEAAEATRAAHEALAREAADQLRGAGREAVAECREGDPATEIIAAAAEFDADLIVLATRGRTGLRRLVLGSVARNVLHHAACSVLVVRGLAHSPTEKE